MHGMAILEILIFKLFYGGMPPDPPRDSHFQHLLIQTYTCMTSIWGSQTWGLWDGVAKEDYSSTHAQVLSTVCSPYSTYIP